MPTVYERSAPATADQVTRDANLIARNLKCHGAGVAAAETADHIRKFWAPSLRSVLRQQLRAHPERFSPTVTDAVAMLEGPQPASPGAP